MIDVTVNNQIGEYVPFDIPGFCDRIVSHGDILTRLNEAKSIGCQWVFSDCQLNWQSC